MKLDMRICLRSVTWDKASFCPRVSCLEDEHCESHEIHDMTCRRVKGVLRRLDQRLQTAVSCVARPAPSRTDAALRKPSSSKCAALIATLLLRTSSLRSPRGRSSPVCQQHHSLATLHVERDSQPGGQCSMVLVLSILVVFALCREPVGQFVIAASLLHGWAASQPDHAYSLALFHSLLSLSSLCARLVEQSGLVP